MEWENGRQVVFKTARTNQKQHPHYDLEKCLQLRDECLSCFVCLGFFLLRALWLPPEHITAIHLDLVNLVNSGTERKPNNRLQADSSFYTCGRSFSVLNKRSVKQDYQKCFVSILF